MNIAAILLNDFDDSDTRFKDISLFIFEKNRKEFLSYLQSLNGLSKNEQDSNEDEEKHVEIEKAKQDMNKKLPSKKFIFNDNSRQNQVSQSTICTLL